MTVYRGGAMMANILVVDDEPMLRSLLTDVFSEVGYHVRAAGDGLEALSAADQDAPDLVVADVSMPNLDGASLAGRLRARGVPVVLLSAVYDAVDLPGIPFLPKPFDLEELLDIVAETLGEPN
jgi:two-component system OmpR family response regulator